MQLSLTTPILRIFDEVLARRFYIDYLGFEPVFEHRFEPHLPLYMGIRQGACSIHLSGHHGDACPGASMRIAVDDVQAYQRTLVARGQYLTAPVETMPWGTRDFTVIDPFGNRLTFTSAISL